MIMAIYETNFTNLTGMYSVIQFANDASDGVLIMGLMLAVFVVLLFGLKKYEFNDAFLAASWVSFLISLFFVFAGLLNIYFVIAFLIMAAFATFYKFTINRQ